MKSIQERVCDEHGLDPEETFFLPKEFDHCLAGVDYLNACVVYFSDKVIETLVDVEGLSLEDAMEHFSYNIQGSLGEGFPTYIERLKNEPR
jgi:hypothetical protein